MQIFGRVRNLTFRFSLKNSHLQKVKSAQQEFEEFDDNIDDIEMEMSEDDEYKESPKKPRIEKSNRKVTFDLTKVVN